MGSYAVIAETSQAMLDLLREHIARRTDAIDVDPATIVLTSPNDIEEDDDVRLSLYLYGIEKNDVLNTGARTYDEEEQVAQDPPLALDLQYLLTAYPAASGGDLTSERIDQHRILGLAIQTLLDTSVIEGSEFGGPRFDKDVSITLQTTTTADARDIWWNAVSDLPYHLSIAYTVSPVLVDSRTEAEIPPVADRDLGFKDKDEEGARQERRRTGLRD